MTPHTAVSIEQDQDLDRGAVIAEFASGLDLSVLPEEAITKLKELLIDTVGVTLGAQDQAHARQARAVATSGGGALQATILGTTLRTGTLDAAFANGVAAHGIDFDDTHKFVHPGCVVVPAVLALAEHRGISGAEFLTALAAGYETSIRVAFAAGVAHRHRGFHPTGTCNVFGAAVGAARALGLDAKKTASAIGASTSMASGLTQYRFDGAANKHLHGGLAARSGVLAALLAEQDFHGTAHALDGEFGFLNLYSDGGDLDALTGELGSRYDLLDTDIKPYPSCRQSHAEVDLAMEASARHNVTADQVEKATIYVYSYADQPWYTANTVPTSALKAFLAIPYCVSSVLLYGRLGLQEFSDKALLSTDLADLIGRINVEADMALDANWPGERGARMEITMRNGETLVLATTNPVGGTEKPLSFDDIIRKFDGLTDGVLTAPRRDAFLDAVAGLERLESVSNLINPLAANS